jgi:hypothetical protein
VLHAEYLGHAADAWGAQRAIFIAEGTSTAKIGA